MSAPQRQDYFSTSPSLGVLAFGDSITNGGGELQWGVALQSWAMWVARGLGLPFTSYAVDGGTAGDVVHAQIPAWTRVAARPAAHYDLGCLYIGVNDVRSLQWDARAFELDFRCALGSLRDHCDRLLTVTAPLDLGRPRAGAKVADMNAIIWRAARDFDALVLDLADFRGRNLVMADHVHPTAFGQIAIAERALAVLSGSGLPTRVRPSALIGYETTWRQRLRGDATYAYRQAKVSFRAGAIRALVAARGPSGPSRARSEARQDEASHAGSRQDASSATPPRAA